MKRKISEWQLSPILSERACSLIRIKVLAVLAATQPAGASAAQYWMGTWVASPQRPVRGRAQTFRNQTLRLIVHTSAGRKTVRGRIANTFSDQPRADSSVITRLGYAQTLAASVLRLRIITVSRANEGIQRNRRESNPDSSRAGMPTSLRGTSDSVSNKRRSIGSSLDFLHLEPSSADR